MKPVDRSFQNMTSWRFFLALGLLVGSLRSYSQQVYQSFQQNERYGIQLENGTVVLPAEYEFLGWSERKFEVIEKYIGYRKSGFWGIVSVTGEIIVPAKYRRLNYSGNGLIEASLTVKPGETKEGVIDLQGKVVVPFEYDYLRFVSDKMIIGQGEADSRRFGLAEKSGQLIIKPEWKSIRGLQDRFLLVENFNRNKALYDLEGYPKTGFFLDSAKVLINGDIAYYQGPMVGCIHPGGTIPDKAIFKDVRPSGESNTEVLRFNRWALLNGSNQEMDGIDADSVRPTPDGRFKIYRNGWSAEINGDLKEPFPEDYQPSVRPTASITVKKVKTGFGLSDEKGIFIIPPIYDKIEWDGTYALVTEKSEEGKSRVRISLPREQGWMSQPFEKVFQKEDQFIVFNYGRYGLTDRYGKELIPSIYDSIYDAKGMMVAVQYLGKIGLMTLDQKWIVFPQSHPITLVDEYRYIIHQFGQNRLRDITGTTLYVSPYELRNVGNGEIEELLAGGERNCLLADGTPCPVEQKFLENPIETKKPKIRKPVVNTSTTAGPIEFPETEGLKGFQENEKFGFKDSRGRIRISNRYDSIRPFKEGRAAIKLMGKWGYIEASDRIAIQPAFTEALDFSEGVAQVRKDGKWGIIDLKGAFLLKPEYEEIVMLSGSKNLLVRSNGLYGLISTTGKLLLEPRYEELLPTLNDQWLVKNGLYGIITTEGIPIVPLNFKNLYFIPERSGYLIEKKVDWELLTP